MAYTGFNQQEYVSFGFLIRMSIITSTKYALPILAVLKMKIQEP